MKVAGIKVWVLTGDKVETAQNIGQSAGLLDYSMEQHIVESQQLDTLRLELQALKNEISSIREKSPNKKQAVLINGASLGLISDQ